MKLGYIEFINQILYVMFKYTVLLYEEFTVFLIFKSNEHKKLKFKILSTNIYIISVTLETINSKSSYIKRHQQD